MSTEGIRAMTADAAPASEVRLRAGELSRDSRRVIGPLNGYHHETYAFPLPEESELSARFERAKLRAPRPGLLWFDRRCFASEDLLLTALQGRITRIPEIIEVGGGVHLQGFIEGVTLDGGARSLPGRCLPGRYPGGRGLSRRHHGQLERFFHELVSIDPKALEEREVKRVCAPADRTDDGDSAAFLDRLIGFTEEQVYRRHGAPYQRLFEELGVGAEALVRLRERAVELRRRPFSLLHCDLHRKNLIVDRRGDLWIIDWELAMIGDPLYDLATHLHLMRYPRREAAGVAHRWQRAVERAREGSSYGWEDDLPLLLAYKRVQSVYTDVIRTALLLGERPGRARGALPRAAWRIRRVLAAAARDTSGADQEPNGAAGVTGVTGVGGAAGVAGAAGVPSYRQVVAAYRNWFRTARPPEALTPSGS
ncbi:phosphotransferase family protein [Streptomyces sp. NPDC088182]|uniref:phosphotransferase family protein n=1 Tax=Streptomyces sp. NPDC088182 TaxID=3365838 RepID=UPI003818F08E